MSANAGELLVGAWLKVIRGCDVVSYNVRPPGGGLKGLEELDVVGLHFQTRTAYLCEVTTHIRGTESYPQAEVVQVKQKFGALRVYWRVPPEHEEPVASMIYQLEERSRSTCEWCGGAGAGGECAECAANPHPPGLELHGRETEALRQWVSSEPRRNRPEWMRPLLLEPGGPDWDLLHDAVRRVERS